MTTQDDKPNTIYLTPEYVQKADAIAAALSAKIGVPIKRSSVVRRAIDDLFLSLRLPHTTDDTPERQIANR